MRHGSSTRRQAPAPEARVDWRFLLPDPRLGPVWLAPEYIAERRALGAIGVEVVAEADNAAVAFVGGSRCDLDEIESTLPRGTLVRIAVVGAGLSRSGQGPSWRVAKEVQRRGWQPLGKIWAVGGIKNTVAYVDLNDSHAVRHLLRMAPRRGKRARLRVTVQLVLARFRLWRALCNEGFVVARTPM
jgi:hypothetical protein